MIRGLILAWLGFDPRPISREEYDKLTRRVEDIARHFIVQRDAKGQPTQTLADKHADEDGRPRPEPFRAGNWQRERRFLEAQHAKPKVKRG